MSTRQRRLREADLCQCQHTYEDHVWGFGEPEPCDIPGCRCRDFLRDGSAP